MKVKTQDYDDITVVQFQGELTADFVEIFRNTCSNVVARTRKSGPKGKKTTASGLGIVIDMSKVGFIDSQGLEQLLWLRDFAAQNGCELRLAGLDENCARILAITRLAEKFDRYAELTEAVKSFA